MFARRIEMFKYLVFLTHVRPKGSLALGRESESIQLTWCVFENFPLPPCAVVTVDPKAAVNIAALVTPEGGSFWE